MSLKSPNNHSKPFPFPPPSLHFIYRACLWSGLYLWLVYSQWICYFLIRLLQPCPVVINKDQSYRALSPVLCTTVCPVLDLKMTADPDYFTPGCVWSISICFMLTWANVGYLSKLHICLCVCVCVCALTYIHIFMFGPLNPILNAHILTPSSDFICNKPHFCTAVQILWYFYAAPPEKYIPTHFVKYGTATMKIFRCMKKKGVGVKMCNNTSQTSHLG